MAKHFDNIHLCAQLNSIAFILSLKETSLHSDHLANE